MVSATKEENDDYMKTFFDRFDKKDKKMKPLENYKLVFYGDKMVTLESANIDYLYRPALMANYIERDGKVKRLTYYITFHRPKPGAPLEIIR